MKARSRLADSQLPANLLIRAAGLEHLRHLLLPLTHPDKSRHSRRFENLHLQTVRFRKKRVSPFDHFWNRQGAFSLSTVE